MSHIIVPAVDAHSGYALPFPLSPFSLFGVADQHDYHHSQNKGCYGSFFGLWDWYRCPLFFCPALSLR
jgi:sterol desaturase/sphingolipid hydroxylase (fatty acid hydroxylase superfamily)